MVTKDCIVVEARQEARVFRRNSGGSVKLELPHTYRAKEVTTAKATCGKASVIESPDDHVRKLLCRTPTTQTTMAQQVTESQP